MFIASILSTECCNEGCKHTLADQYASICLVYTYASDQLVSVGASLFGRKKSLTLSEDEGPSCHGGWNASYKNKKNLSETCRSMHHWSFRGSRERWCWTVAGVHRVSSRKLRIVLDIPWIPLVIGVLCAAGTTTEEMAGTTEIGRSSKTWKHR